jgi:hypothetical protein
MIKPENPEQVKIDVAIATSCPQAAYSRTSLRNAIFQRLPILTTSKVQYGNAKICPPR